ncbi:GAF domain-containing protein [Synechococcus sp. PCC 7335]|uniref:GAF domain-containing protein n=1 Tax=Synechococcus sp. (strain ATCC 29403 / PCC 7335) TaxID=91464 RepID=UPI000571EF62|nr:GAF domain-containing protein [Synechococcus sp. PCC 7335]
MYASSTASTVSTDDCQQALARNLEYQKVLGRILHKVRNSVSLDAICMTTSQEIVRLLNVERIAFYQFDADWSGQFIDEYGYAGSPWNQIEAFGQHQVWKDTHLQETQGGRYKTHDPFAVPDIYEAGHARCHIEMLEQYQIRAYAIAPIFAGNKLWGLLAAYQHSAPRDWSNYEIDFLAQAADYLGIAFQHSLELQSSAARQRSLSEVVGKIRSSLSVSAILETACEELCNLLFVERAAVYQFDKDWSGNFVCEHSPYSQLDGVNPFGKNQVWEDTHLKETKGGRYRNNESFTVADIYQADHARCHLDVLEQFKIRAYALAPIFVGDRLWGLFGAYQHTTTHDWQGYEIDFLTQLAAQIGVAIQQAELLGYSKTQAIALEKSVSRQKALTEVVSKVRSALDIDLILITTCKEAVNLLEVDRVAVYRFNEDWSGQFVSSFYRQDPDAEVSIPFGQTPVWEDTHLQETQGGRYRNNETLAINDIYKADYARCHIDLLEQYKVRAYALVPIFVGQTLWGLLAAYQHLAPYEWQKVEVDFLSQVANQLGVAIQSAKTLKDSQIRAEDLQQAAEQREILFDVVAKIRESLDLETIFNTTAQEVRRSLRADRVGIFKFEDDSNYCRGQFVAEDVLYKFGSAMNLMLEDHCFGDSYATQYSKGRMQIIADVLTANFQACHVNFLERLQIKAQIVVPLMKGTELWGLLCIHQCEHTRHWADSAVEFVKQVAVQLSVALLQASLHAQTQKQAEQLAESVKELQSAQLKVIQSEKMASLGQLVAGVAHEINNPISFIYGNLTHAEDYVTDLLQIIDCYQSAYPTPESSVTACLSSIDADFIRNDLPKLFQSMQVGTQRIREIVSSLRNFSRLDESAPKTVDIHEGIDSTLMILQNRLKPSPSQPGIHIIKNYDSLPKVECFPGQLNQVFMNLLANAIDALEERNQDRSEDSLEEDPSRIEITTSVHQPDSVAIRIADNGSGMPQEMLDSVFDPFFTTKPVGKGTGLGLSISYQIVTEKHNGKLYCHSSQAQGTEFVIEIPIEQKEMAH